jgi:prevent-host-death family protein
MTHRWTVQEAKAQLSKLMKRARAGEPQRIGLQEGCVLVSEADWEKQRDVSFEEWLVKTAPRGEPLKEASRKSRRGNPFAEPKTRRTA